MRLARAFAAGVAAAFLSACTNSDGGATAGLLGPNVPPTQITPQAGLRAKIGHIIVISQENWGFDGLYARYPGANGSSGALTLPQVDGSGNTIATLPQPLIGGKPDARFPATLAAQAFDMSAYVSPSSTTFTGDPNHNFYVQQYQIDGAPISAAQPGAGGKMDRYLALAGVPGDGTQGGLPMGQYDATNLPEGKIAQQFVLADNFHQSAFGGSFINNMWLFCACTGVYPIAQAPSTIVEKLDITGNPVALGSPEGRLTPDGYAVNTMFPYNYPQTAGKTPGDPTSLLPVQTAKTIGDSLTAANVSWKWYAGGLTNALAGTPDATYQAHHQAPLFFANYAPGTPGAQHVVDESAFLTDLASGNLPAVSFVKNLGANNEHPGYTNLLTGQMYTANLVNQIMMSPVWKDALVVIFYDEAGGHYDHAPPMPVDRWGPSTRVPALIVSPWAQHGIVDHTNYEVVSILSTIEARFGLAPLGSRDAAAAPFYGALNFNQPAAQALARRPLNIEQALPAPPKPLSRTGHYPVTELDD